MHNEQSGSHRYLHLIEGHRDSTGKVNQRVVASLGRLDQLDAKKNLEHLINGLQRAVGLPETMPHAPQFESARAFDGV